jgi:hypothetical protein
VHHATCCAIATEFMASRSRQPPIRWGFTRCSPLFTPRGKIPICERLIGSIRRECLDHFIVFNERGLHRTLKSYFEYYEQSRTHLSLDKDAPLTASHSTPRKWAELPRVLLTLLQCDRVFGKDNLPRVIGPDGNTQISVAPDGSPVFTRDIGTQEIYALTVKWP